MEDGFAGSDERRQVPLQSRTEPKHETWVKNQAFELVRDAQKKR